METYMFWVTDEIGHLFKLLKDQGFLKYGVSCV